jgi:hypothetical protein
MTVPLDNTVPLGIEIVTLVPFSVDKIEAKLSKLLSKVGLTSRPTKYLPNALLQTLILLHEKKPPLD